jgi:cytochrome oxidase Cu insertion factor (SCO1/SenC/PrrC family)
MRAHSATALLVVGVNILLCCALSAGRAQEEPERSAAELMDALMWNREPVGGPFALVDHTGRQRTEADFRGKLLFIYFGFTSCPDVCPTDLQAMGMALDQLGTVGDAVQPLFVTVDPERDTPQRLDNYVTLFHPRLIGLSGDATSIRQAARAYKVYYAKVPTPDGSDYTVDHSGYIYLMDHAGQYLGFFPPGTPPDRMADVIRPLVGRAQRRCGSSRIAVPAQDNASA